MERKHTRIRRKPIRGITLVYSQSGLMFHAVMIINCYCTTIRPVLEYCAPDFATRFFNISVRISKVSKREASLSHASLVFLIFSQVRSYNLDRKPRWHLDTKDPSPISSFFFMFYVLLYSSLLLWLIALNSSCNTLYLQFPQWFYLNVQINTSAEQYGNKKNINS